MKIIQNDGEIQLTMHVDHDFLITNFREAAINLENIHIVIFKEEEDIYINNDNYHTFFQDPIMVSDIISYEESARDDITINKLKFDYLNYNVFYDDDALLVIKIKTPIVP